MDYRFGKEKMEAFSLLKTKLAEATLITKFDRSLPIILCLDASPTGIEAVLLHLLHTGDERLISHVSKTLNTHQRGYSQMEREGLAVIFVITKFHQYLYGTAFTLVTDNKKLISLFNQQKKFSILASRRIQRWNILLVGYTYQIEYRESKKNVYVDALSRSSMGSYQKFDCKLADDINLIKVMDAPLNIQKIREKQRRMYHCAK